MCVRFKDGSHASATVQVPLFDLPNNARRLQSRTARTVTIYRRRWPPLSLAILFYLQIIAKRCGRSSPIELEPLEDFYTQSDLRLTRLTGHLDS
jgi:hypothetical protein